MIVFLFAPAALAQESNTETTAGSEVAVADFSQPMGPPDALNRGTPRGSLYGFVDACNARDYERAARYLDLRGVPPDERARAPELARRLKAVLNQEVWIDFFGLSDDAAGAQADGLPPSQDHVAELRIREEVVPFLMQRVPREHDGVFVWKIAASTVAKADVLYEELGPTWLETWLPRFFFEWSLLGFELWQWAGVFAAAIAAWLIAVLVTGTILRISTRLILRRASHLSPPLARLLHGPVCLALAVVAFGAAHQPLALPVPAAEVLNLAGNLLLVATAAWFSFRLVDLFALHLHALAEEHANLGALSIVAPTQTIIKILIASLGVITVLGILGVNVTAAVAGLGVGGIAIALAAQKSLENLFGGVMLFTDRPVRVGDYFSSGNYQGTVEEIGLRSTRVRTLDRTLITIPNGEFSNMALENFAPVDHRRLVTTLGVRYETTSEQLRYLLARLREILVAHPRVLDDPLRVRFVGFGPYSLNIEIFAYIDTRDRAEFLAIQEDVLLHFIDVVAEAGSGFAFPSSTVYVGQDTGLDEEGTRRAEARVAEWREKGHLPFPEFPDQVRGTIHNTLAWPPKGAPGNGDRLG